MGAPLKLLVCDDSRTIRRLLGLLIDAMPEATVAAEAEDAETAWAILATQPIDAVLLDLNLPGRHGFELLERIMRELPRPVIVISGASSQRGAMSARARELGAIAYLEKPDGQTTGADTLEAGLRNALARLQHPAGPRAAAPVVPLRPAARRDEPLLAIGSSTGGVVAVMEVLRGLKGTSVPVVITQHLLPGYAAAFAQRIATVTGLSVTAAVGGEVLQPGMVVVAPGDRHLVVTRQDGRLICGLDDRPRISGHRPSCDVLFESVAAVAGARTVGVILTGMGRDGADGLLAMRRAGARTFAQDEESCVVFGMPRAALDNGGAERAVPLGELGRVIAATLAGTDAEPRPVRAGMTRSPEQPTRMMEQAR
jgi:two-component system chemotaxis response regulator CheB